jgi:dipeptidyl aminopeptidase/acylaminoacyl peptidase
MTFMRATRIEAGSRAAAAVAALAGAIACGSGSVARAQAQKPMTLLDLAAVPRVGDPQLSPDGRAVSYYVQSADWKTDHWTAHIWRQSTAGGAPVRLTRSDADERFARWSPDGRTILFMSGGQLFLVPAEGGEPKALPRHQTPLVFPSVSPNDVGIGWSSDGRSVYFIAREPPAAARARPGQLVVFEQTDFEQQHLWKVDVASGKEEQVTRGEWSVISFRLSQDGRHATLLRSPTPQTIDHYRSDVWLLDLESGALHEVTHNNNYETEAELSPDGSQIYFLTDANQDLEDYYGPSLFVVPAAGGKPRRVSPAATYVVELGAWAPDGKSLLAVANMGVHSEIVRVDVATGATTPLTSGNHQILGWRVARSANQMVYQVDEPTRLGDVWTLPTSGGAPARVTGVYDALDRDFALPKQERITWKGADGVAIEGVLFYPAGYEQGKRYPLVVQLHGGPQLSDKFGFGAGVLLNYVPVLTARGYAVLRPNYRGSSGYGPAFYRDIVGHYFNNMHLDVMAGVDRLIEMGIADPDRLAVSGWSAGGTLVNKLITFTNRFKAASSGAGVANWISMMAQTDVLTRRTSWFHSTPWDKDADLGAFLSQSPIKDIGKVKTPTIFFVGSRDTRDPPPQSQEMYAGLNHNGIPSRLEIAPDEAHDAGGWSVRHTLAKDNDELGWFEKYVMNRSYQPEAPPEDTRPAR